MSEIEQGNPLDKLESEHLSTLDEFDGVKSCFYDWLSGEAVEYSGITTDNIDMQEYIDDQSTAFVELAISCRAEAPDISTAIEDIVEFWRQDNVERVELYTGIVEEGSFCVLDKEDIERTVLSIFAESDDDFDLAQHIREMYGGYLKGDVMNFVSCLEYRNRATTQEDLDDVEEKVIARHRLIDSDQKGWDSSRFCDCGRTRNDNR